MTQDLIVGKELARRIMTRWVVSQQCPYIITFVGIAGVGKNYLTDWFVHHFTTNTIPNESGLWTPAEPYEHFYKLDSGADIRDQIPMLIELAEGRDLFVSVSNCKQDIPSIANWGIHKTHIIVMNESGAGIHVNMHTTAEVAELLKFKGVPQEKAARLAYASNGIVGNALKNIDMLDPLNNAKNIMRKILTGNTEECLNAKLSFGKDIEQGVDHLVSYWDKFVATKQIDNVIAIKLHKLLMETKVLIAGSYNKEEILTRFLLNANFVVNSDPNALRELSRHI